MKFPEFIFLKIVNYSEIRSLWILSLIYNLNMCRFNAQCNGQSQNCLCSKGHPYGAFKPCQSQCLPSPIKEQPFPTTLFQDKSELLMLLFQRQSELINALTYQSATIIQKLDQISHNLKGMAAPSQATNNCLSAKNLLQVMQVPDHEFDYFLKLENDFPNPAYKERAFQLELSLVDKEGKYVHLEESLIFKALLYSAETSPKLVEMNTIGDKIIRGTVEVEGRGKIVFRKLVVKEVSSHFRGGVFYFVICPEGNYKVKPFILPNFTVKARKANKDPTPCKKPKQE